MLGKALATILIVGCLFSVSLVSTPHVSNAWAAFCATSDAVDSDSDEFVCGAAGAWHAFEAGLVAGALGAGPIGAGVAGLAVGL